MGAERKRVKRWLRERYGESKRPRSKPKSPRKLPWKPIVVALIAIMVVAAVVALRPWEGEPSEGQPTSEEYVWVQYLASFKLLSTSDNGPIENLVTYWPYPYTMPETWEVAESLDEIASIVLYQPRENIDIVFFPGNRTEDRENILFSSFYENWNANQEEGKGWLPIYPPVENSKSTVSSLSLNISEGKIYPGDMFQVEAWFKLPPENAKRTTLVDSFGENLHATLQILRWTPDKTIGITVSAKLTEFRANGFDTFEQWTYEKSDGIFNPISIELFRT